MSKILVTGGLGFVGSHLVDSLADDGHDVTVIDSDQNLVKMATDTLDVKGVSGFASYPDVLADAGAADADMIIAVTGDESAEQLLHLGKPIRWVSPDEQFKTPSQIALDESDWKMLRKLEALLPEDDALRMERNALRAAVDDEL